MTARKTATRMSKAERREQLLETAQQIVRTDGTDALTLAGLAEKAGVSKPITYEHFATRSGLLIALARYMDDRQVALFVSAVKTAKAKLDDVARVTATAYMHCYATTGPEWHAITAALAGDDEMDRVQHELIDRYVGIYVDALAPVTKLPKRELQQRCVAIIGAAEAMARDMFRGRIDEKTAATALASLITSWLKK